MLDILVTVPMSRVSAIPGSLPDKCSKCGKPVWISPESFPILHEYPDIRIICLDCLPAIAIIVAGEQNA